MKNIRLKIYSKLVLLEVFIIIGMRFLVPTLSNYPPYSELSEFQLKIEALTHDQQYILLGIIAIILHLIFITLFFRNIFKYLKKDKSQVSIEETIHVRKDCFNIPRKLLLIQICILAIVLSMLFTMVQISIVLCIKFLLIYFSFFIASWALSMALIKEDLNKIIESTYEINKEVTMPKRQTKFYKSLIVNLIPFFAFIMITLSLLSYAKVCDQNGESSFYYYKQFVSSLDLGGLSTSMVENELDKVVKRNDSDYYFIITENNQIFSSPDGQVTNFFLEYANEFIDQTDGRLYEYYGVEEEAYAEYVVLADGSSALVGFKYSTINVTVVYFFITISILAIAVYIIILFIWTKNISKSITQVSDRLSEIAQNVDINKEYILPVFSNDEIAELTIAFNKIQKLTRDNISKLHDNQDTLMEQERLASLGQLIGGIAHNLKTPIMSISGAAEGLNDLIKEYDTSIDDPEVNSKDHHDIAKDMSEWIVKIRQYTAYMSDIITVVKGQAVSLSADETVKFTVEELIKRINILMKHELKNAIIYLNVSLSVDNNLTLSGDINSLVQVINNMISNSIQAYNGMPEQNIDMKLKKQNNNLIISITDYADGLPEEVQEKLFKEMITTKGKNGTGLGLYMSYSNIKARFNGNITFETEQGKGTTFNIILPLE